MNTSKKDNLEIFVHKKQTVSVVCPECRLEKKLGVEKIRDVPHWGVKATCKRCAHVFTVSFNFRKYFRKPVSLSGALYSAPDAEVPLAAIHVHDISLAGIGFSSDSTEIDKQAILTLRFTLDDTHQSEVEKEIFIESIRKGRIGARFVGNTVADTVLNKYILAK